MKAGTAAGAGVASAFFLRCGQTKDSNTALPSSSSSPKHGGQRELSYASGWNIDPQLDINMGAIVSTRVYGHMFYARADSGETTLLGASKLEQPDDVTYVFTLRSDMHFQDTPDVRSKYLGVAGRLVTAADVKYAIDRYRGLAGGPGRDYVLNRMDQVEAPDDVTVRVTNKSPFSWTLSSLSLGSPLCAPFLAHEVVEKEGELKTVAVGSGPFTLDYASQTQGVRFVRNPNYFVPDEPFIDSERYRIANDVETSEAAFRSGQIDTYVSYNRPQADGLADLPGTYQLKAPDLRVAMFGVNTRKDPWKDERVVKALHYAIDRDSLILTLEGGKSGDNPEDYGKWCGAMPWGIEFYALTQEELKKALPPLDIAQAKALLSAAGLDSVSSTLRHLNILKHPALAEMIATQLKQANINLTLEPMDLATFVSRVPLQFDFETNSRYNVAMGTPEQPLRIFLTTGGQGSGSEWGLSYPDVDAAFEETCREFDLEERRQKVRAVQQLIFTKYAPVLFLYAPYAFYQVRDYVQNVMVAGGNEAWYNYRVWLDK